MALAILYTCETVQTYESFTKTTCIIYATFSIIYALTIRITRII